MDLSPLHAFVEQHKVLLALGGTIPPTALIAGWAGRLVGHRNALHEFKHGQRRKRVEFVSVEPRMVKGEMVLDFTVAGEGRDIEDVFGEHDMLGERIEAATRHVGDQVFLRLPDQEHHREMMEAIEDAFTGLDPDANVDARAGREVDVDGEYFAPTYHPDAWGIRKIRIYIVNENLIRAFGDPNFKVRAAKRRWDDRVQILRDMYTKSKDNAPGTGGTSVVWHAANKTSRNLANGRSILPRAAA